MIRIKKFKPIIIDLFPNQRNLKVNQSGLFDVYPDLICLTPNLINSGIWISNKPFGFFQLLDFLDFRTEKGNLLT